MRTAFCITLSVIASAGVFLLLSSGCRPASPSAVTASPSALRTPAVRSTALSITAAKRVQSLPLYQQAQKACDKKLFSKAEALLEQLAASPDLSKDEIAFCKHERDLLLHPADPTHPPVPVSAPTHQEKQNSSASSDCGPRALLIACEKLGIKTSLSELTKAAGTSAKSACSAIGCSPKPAGVRRDAPA